jgi:hypothetical protein
MGDVDTPQTPMEGVSENDDEVVLLHLVIYKPGTTRGPNPSPNRQ